MYTRCLWTKISYWIVSYTN